MRADEDDGGEIPAVDMKPKLDATCPGEVQFDAAERQSAMLYVSRLSRFIVTLVSKATSSVEADKLLQQFASDFCTGI